MNIVNKKLWESVSAFNLDNPPSEYGFSTRLAYENFWTKEFTILAIEEYKKFMYLAASSDLMVSPSEIVDSVWHQHLIFTQSYQEFCNLLGKKIQHIPSTHNKEDFQKFKQAKERTTKLYEKEFGTQPKGIWGYNGMFESLNLEKSRLKLRSFIIIGILIFLVLIIPAYYFLKPAYVEFKNPQFMIGLVILSVFTFTVLEIYNRSVLSKITSLFDKNSFVYDLHPFELVYLKTQELKTVINGTINELIDKGTIFIDSSDYLALTKSGSPTNQEQFQVTAELSELGPTNYPYLLKRLKRKYIFAITSNSMDAFIKYFHKSKRFGYLFYINFFSFAILLMLSLTRIATGIMRDKPVVQIVLFTFLLCVAIVFFLHRLTQQEFTSIIPDLYRNDLLPARKTEINWQWNYFLAGTAVLSTAFIPIVKETRKNHNSGGGSSCGGSSGGSTCGSSCSSCGGCGGD